MFFMTEEKEEEVAANVDKFMDSYARDTTVNELKDVGRPPENSEKQPWP
jgi:DNA ligase-4